MLRTACPSPTARRTRADPMKPAPPVTIARTPPPRIQVSHATTVRRNGNRFGAAALDTTLAFGGRRHKLRPRDKLRPHPEGIAVAPWRAQCVSKDGGECGTCGPSFEGASRDCATLLQDEDGNSRHRL